MGIRKNWYTGVRAAEDAQVRADLSDVRRRVAVLENQLQKKPF